jgi:hypothetical protein
MAVSSPETPASPSFPSPSPSSFDYQEPHSLQKFFNWIRGVDPALDMVNDWFPLIMRPVFDTRELIHLEKNLDQQHCFVKLDQYKELVEAKDQMVLLYRHVLEKNEHLLTKPSVQAQVESMDTLVVSERETLLFVFSACSEQPLMLPTGSPISVSWWRLVLEVVIIGLVFVGIFQVYIHLQNKAKAKKDAKMMKEVAKCKEQLRIFKARPNPAVLYFKPTPK